jgi:cob(I)alamin adenosyltransferase
MKIYTKTGDKGTTALLGGRRVHKSELRIEAYGDIDELNSCLGLLTGDQGLSFCTGTLQEIQKTLFVIGSELACDPGNNKPKIPGLKMEKVEELEKAIDSMEEELPELKTFILPGGHALVAYCHIARAVCRRAERKCVALARSEPVGEIVIAYLNRLSDYLFVLARYAGRRLGVPEIPWRP